MIWDDAIQEATRRARAEMKELRKASGPGFLERHGVHAADPTTCRTQEADPIAVAREVLSEMDEGRPDPRVKILAAAVLAQDIRIAELEALSL